MERIKDFLKVDKIESGMCFRFLNSRRLVSSQGSCFNLPNMFRIVGNMIENTIKRPSADDKRKIGLKDGYGLKRFPVIIQKSITYTNLSSLVLNSGHFYTLTFMLNHNSNSLCITYIVTTCCTHFSYSTDYRTLKVIFFTGICDFGFISIGMKL